jgi:hypothetical protein
MILLRPLAKLAEFYIYVAIVLPFMAACVALDWCDEIWGRLTA